MNIKDKIISRLKKVSIPQMLSLSIIGSFISKESLGETEDIDIYLILEKIDSKVFTLIVREFQTVCKDLSDNTTVFFPEFRAGAFKPKYVKGKKMIQLHVLINTPDMFSKKSSMVSLDWRLNNLLIKGKKVSDFLSIEKFSKDELVDGRDGLKHFLSLLDSSKKTYMEWSIKGNSIERIKKDVNLKSKEDWFELIQAVVIQGFVNFIRLTEPSFSKIESKIIEKSNVLPKNHATFLKKILLMKKDFKKTGKLSYDLDMMKISAKKFIIYLISRIKN